MIDVKCLHHAQQVEVFGIQPQVLFFPLVGCNEGGSSFCKEQAQKHLVPKLLPSLAVILGKWISFSIKCA